MTPKEKARALVWGCCVYGMRGGEGVGGETVSDASTDPLDGIREGGGGEQLALDSPCNSSAFGFPPGNVVDRCWPLGVRCDQHRGRSAGPVRIADAAGAIDS